MYVEIIQKINRQITFSVCFDTNKIVVSNFWSIPKLSVYVFFKHINRLRDVRLYFATLVRNDPLTILLIIIHMILSDKIQLSSHTVWLETSAKLSR